MLRGFGQVLVRFYRELEAQQGANSRFSGNLHEDCEISRHSPDHLPQCPTREIMWHREGQSQLAYLRRNSSEAARDYYRAN